MCVVCFWLLSVVCPVVGCCLFVVAGVACCLLAVVVRVLLSRGVCLFCLC